MGGIVLPTQCRWRAQQQMVKQHCHDGTCVGAVGGVGVGGVRVGGPGEGTYIQIVNAFSDGLPWDYAQCPSNIYDCGAHMGLHGIRSCVDTPMLPNVSTDRRNRL